MQVEKLRSLIRESINEYIREVEESGNIAAQEAKITSCEEAIAIREKKINMEGLDESFHDMISEEKLKELKNEIRALENYKKKATKLLEKMKAKKASKGSEKKEKEVTTDAVTEEAPIDESDITAEMNMSDENMKEEALNESFTRMQKIAGIIK